MARTSNSMLSKSGDSGCPCLALDLRGNAFSFLLLRCCQCGLVISGLYFVEVCSLWTHFDVFFFKSYTDVELCFYIHLDDFYSLVC